VVSLPSWEIFEQQEESYRQRVFPPDVLSRVSVEAGSVFGWERYVGLNGAIVGMTTFGASAPAKDLFKKYGFTTDHVIQVAKEVLARNKQAK
jgi:transketolase